MSQSKEFNDDKLASYYSAIESFQYLASLFNDEHLNFTQIYQEMHKCYERIETLIFDEGPSTTYVVHLFQLKKLINELIQIMHRIVSSVSTVPKPNKKQQPQKTSIDKAQSIIKSTIEIPRVNGLKEIAGLSEVKKILRSLVILPQNQPQLFYNSKACNSILLFGPPGTGKTRLVHALAAEANAILHCVSASALMSPLVGQTEKNVQVLFEHLKSNNFSILFIDEVDGLCRTRHDSEQDHTRRMKTELMCQMSKIEDDTKIFLICATNCPWDLDTAFLRRFHRRIYVPLPGTAERHELFDLFLKNTSLEIHSEYWDHLIQKTEGFSGSDISSLVQIALNMPITELEDTKIWKFAEDGLYEPVVMAEDFSLENIHCCELNDLPFQSVRARPVHILDLLSAIDGATRTVSVVDVQRYETFKNK